MISDVLEIASHFGVRQSLRVVNAPERNAEDQEAQVDQQFPLRRPHFQKVRREGEVTNGQAAATCENFLIRWQIAPNYPEKSTKNFSQTPYFPRDWSLSGNYCRSTTFFGKQLTRRRSGNGFYGPRSPQAGAQGLRALGTPKGNDSPTEAQRRLSLS